MLAITPKPIEILSILGVDDFSTGEVINGMKVKEIVVSAGNDNEWILKDGEGGYIAIVNAGNHPYSVNFSIREFPEEEEKEEIVQEYVLYRIREEMLEELSKKIWRNYGVEEVTALEYLAAAEAIIGKSKEEYLREDDYVEMILKHVETLHMNRLDK